MNIILYGLPMCSKCKTAQMMLDKRNIKYEYVSLSSVCKPEFSLSNLPVLKIGNKTYEGKDALIKIRGLK